MFKSVFKSIMYVFYLLLVFLLGIALSLMDKYEMTFHDHNFITIFIVVDSLILTLLVLSNILMIYYYTDKTTIY